MSKSIFPRTHVSLKVKSIGETEIFYTKFFEAEPAKVKGDYLKYELDEPALTISFIRSEEVQPEVGHFGIQVKTKSELNRKLNLARGNELLEKEEMNVGCCYAYQDKFWVKDPDGYAWEVYHFINDLEEHENVEKTEQTCC